MAKLISYIPSFMSMLYYGEMRQKNDHDYGILQDISDMFGGMPTPVVDRTKIFTPPLNTKLLEPMRQNPTTNAKFEDCCRSRAKELLETDKQIDVYWSGGIDATTALVALLEQDEHNQVNVKLNYESIGEYPWFFENIIKKRCNYEMFDGYYCLDYNLDNLIVTGLCGDKLFGSLEMLQDKSERNLPWNTAFYNIFNVKSNIRETLISRLPIHLKKCPFEVRTQQDLLFWLGYSMHWQMAHTRWMIYLPCDSKEKLENVQAFFNSQCFEKWALTNPDLRMKDTWNTYKFPMKDYIYKYTKDKLYRDYKLKVFSSANFAAIPNVWATDDEFNVYYRDDIMEYINNKSTKLEQFLNED